MVQYRTLTKVGCGCWEQLWDSFKTLVIMHNCRVTGRCITGCCTGPCFTIPDPGDSPAPDSDSSHSHYSASPTGGALLNCFTGTQTWKTQGQCFCIINAWMQSKSCSWINSVSSPLASPTHYSLPGILTNVEGVAHFTKDTESQIINEPNFPTKIGKLLEFIARDNCY